MAGTLDVTQFEFDFHPVGPTVAGWGRSFYRSTPTATCWRWPWRGRRRAPDDITALVNYDRAGCPGHPGGSGMARRWWKAFVATSAGLIAGRRPATQ